MTHETTSFEQKNEGDKLLFLLTGSNLKSNLMPVRREDGKYFTLSINSFRLPVFPANLSDLIFELFFNQCPVYLGLYPARSK